MKNATASLFCLSLTLCCSLTTAALQVSAQNTANRETMTNANVIELVTLGLSDAVVIEKIRQSDRKFDTSVAGLRQLKTARVSDAVISVILNSQAAPSPQVVTAPAATRGSAAGVTSVSENVPTATREPGIYLLEGGDHKQIYPTTYVGTKTGGFIGSALTYGIKKTKIRAKLRGPSANLVTNQKRPDFYFHFDPGTINSGLAMSGFLAFGATSPGEFVLVKMERKQNTRETVIGEANIFGASSGTRDKDIRDFAFEKTQSGVFKVTLRADLDPGEYCFFYAGTPQGLGFAGGKLFDFSVTY